MLRPDGAPSLSIAALVCAHQYRRRRWCCGWTRRETEVTGRALKTSRCARCAVPLPLSLSLPIWNNVHPTAMPSLSGGVETSWKAWHRDTLEMRRLRAATSYRRPRLHEKKVCVLLIHAVDSSPRRHDVAPLLPLCFVTGAVRGTLAARHVFLRSRATASGHYRVNDMVQLGTTGLRKRRALGILLATKVKHEFKETHRDHGGLNRLPEDSKLKKKEIDKHCGVDCKRECDCNERLGCRAQKRPTPKLGWESIIPTFLHQLIYK